MTVGGVESDAVVKVQLSVVNGSPAMSRIPVLPPVSVTVYSVPPARLFDGFSVNLVFAALWVSAAGTEVPPGSVTLKVVVVTPWTASLKVTTTFAVVSTPWALDAGARDATVGPVPPPPPVPTVKVEVLGARGLAFGEVSWMAPLSDAVYAMPAWRLLAGIRVATREPGS